MFGPVPAKDFPEGDNDDDGEKNESLPRLGSDKESEILLGSLLKRAPLIHDPRSDFSTSNPAADELAASNEQIASSQQQTVAQPATSNSDRWLSQTLEDITVQGADLGNPNESVNPTLKDTERWVDQA